MRTDHERQRTGPRVAAGESGPQVDEDSFAARRPVLEFLPLGLPSERCEFALEKPARGFERGGTGRPRAESDGLPRPFERPGSGERSCTACAGS